MAKGTCTAEGCNRPNVGRGFCRNHYEQQRRRHGDKWADERAARPTICSIEDCDEKILSREWCSTHYQRWYNHGDPMTKLDLRGEDIEIRFFAKVQIVENGCWLWMGAIGTKWSYPYFKSDSGKMVLAHRWAYERWVGPIPEGFQLDHFVCETKHCVNPGHVRPVTPRENVLRSDGVTARNAAKTHCIRGHEFSEENTYRTPTTNDRQCRICQRETRRRYKARKRGVY